MTVLSPYFISWCAPARKPITSSSSSIQSLNEFQANPNLQTPQVSDFPHDAPYLNITNRSLSVGTMGTTSTMSMGREDRMYENQFFENIELEDGLKPEYGFGLRQAKVLSVQRIAGNSKRTTWVDINRGSPTLEPHLHHPDQQLYSIDLQR